MSVGVSFLSVILSLASSGNSIGADLGAVTPLSTARPTLQTEALDSSLIGSVVDASTARPVSGAVIKIIDRSGRVIGQGITQADGSFAVAGLPAGVVQVRVNSAQYIPAAEPNFRLIDGKAQLLRFSLRPISAETSSTDAADKDIGDDIEEVLIVGRALSNNGFGSVGGTTLNREEIRRKPGTAGDIFRGLNTLPGVVATGEFANFAVRGRGPRDNLILIDDIPYDRAVHFDQALGENEEIGGGGRFSIFGQNVIGQASFEPGGWDAAYGGANGSLLRLDIAEGNPETPLTSLKVDLTGAELLYDGPSYLQDDTSLLVSARYFNFGPLFDLIGQDDIGTPELADLIVKTKTKISGDTTLSLLAIYTEEWFNRDAANTVASQGFENTLLLDSQQTAGVVGITLENLIGSSGKLKNIVYTRFADDAGRQGEAIPELSFGDDITADTLFVDENIINLREKETEIGWRLDYSDINRFGEFSAGSRLVYLSTDYAQSVARDFAVYDFDFNDTRPDPNQGFILLTPDGFDQSLNRDIVRIAGYVQQKVTVGNVTVTPSLRINYDGLLDSTDVSPRLQVDWQAGPRTRLSATAGVFVQPPRLLEIAANGLNANLVPEKTTQISLGLEQYFGDDITMLIEGYYQNLDDLLTDGDRVTGLLTNDGEGETYGVDWSLTKRFSGGWSSSVRYSFVNARRDFNDGFGAFDAEFSRPHLVNATLNYEPNDAWAFALQYQIASGRPADAFEFSTVTSPEGFTRFSRQSTARNVERLRAFQSLNVRVDYRKKIGAVSFIAFVDVINVLGRDNISVLDFSPITGTDTDTGFGAFPQLGLTIEY